MTLPSSELSDAAPTPVNASVVFTVNKPCPVRGGCSCIGICQETMEVVAAADYWRVVGERDEARRSAV